MVRVKRGVMAHKRRRHLLEYAKGFRWGRKSKYALAKDALMHAWSHAYVGRKDKKGDFRRLWQIQINSASRNLGINYSRLINGLKKNKINLNRKMLAEFANNNPKIFEKIVEKAKE